jgi:membrane protein DedA with SNARE-associated domain
MRTLAKSTPLKRLLVAAAAVRAVIGVVAIPLAPFLYREHAVLLVLLRPTKEVLLLMGFLIRRGDVGLTPVLAAAVPLVTLGVWQFFFLGRGYAKEIKSADLPGFLGRLLPPKRICALADAVEARGTRLVLLGRLAAFPSTLVAAGAGVSDMETRRFLSADGIGAVLSIVEVLGAGYLLGQSYEQAGPWITVLGGVVLVLMLVILGRALKSDSGGDKEFVRNLRAIRKKDGVRAMVSEARRQLSARA